MREIKFRAWDKTQTITYNFNQILKWENKFEDLTVQVMAGHETYIKNYDLFYGSKSNFLDPENTEWANAAKVSGLTSYGREYLLEGYFGQTTFDFKNKYYLSASLRRDGSSIFHKDNRWGTFWSIGASWRITEEDFIKDLEFINNLKLKASYGAQGNDYLYLANSTTIVSALVLVVLRIGIVLAMKVRNINIMMLIRLYIMERLLAIL